MNIIPRLTNIFMTQIIRYFIAYFSKRYRDIGLALIIISIIFKHEKKGSVSQTYQGQIF
jgi:hypothetical protein